MAARHEHANHVFGSKGFRQEPGSHGGIGTAGNAQDGGLATRRLEIVPDPPNDMAVNPNQFFFLHINLLRVSENIIKILVFNP